MIIIFSSFFSCLPEIAALIYRVSYKDGVVAPYDSSLDYSANFARMLGYNDPEFDELMRMYLVIHSDHEGGNACVCVLLFVFIRSYD